MEAPGEVVEAEPIRQGLVVQLLLDKEIKEATDQS
jgi:hypothetical protein